jgi:pimeloyl-ACP methyl ester carboxylesterase
MLSGDRDRALRTAWRVNTSERFRADESRYEAFREMADALPVAVEVIMLQMQAIGGHDTSARLREIAEPTLVIHGTDDRMLDASNGELIARLIPGAQLELLADVGHMFWWEEPERSAQLVAVHALADRVAQTAS